MAEGAGSEVKIKVQVDGAAEGQKQLGAVSKILGGLQEQLKGFSQNLRASGGESGLFSVGIDTINQAVTAFRNPLVAVGTALVAFQHSLHESAEEALATHQRMKELTAQFGASVERVSTFTDAYELAGVSTDRLGVAASILASRAEVAGKSFLKFGVEVNDASGNMKEPLTLFEEVRDKLSAIENPSERAAAATELFGRRLAVGLAPALGLSKDQIEKLTQAAEKYSALTGVTDKEAKRLEEQVTLTAKAQQHYNDVWASTLGLPLEAFFEKQKRGWIEVKASFVEKGLGFISALFGIPEAQFEEENARVQKNLMEQAALVAKFKKGATVDNKHITREKAQEMVEEANMEFATQSRRLKAEAAYETQRLALEEDAAAKGIRQQISTTEELVRQENVRFEKVLEAKRRTGYGGASGLNPEEEKKLRREHEDRIFQLEQEAKEKGLTLKREEAAERIRVIEDGLRKEMGLHTRYLANLKDAYEAERGAVKLFADTQAVESTASYKLAIESAKVETQEVVRAVDQRIAAKRAELEAAKGIASEERRINQELVDLSNQRARAEMDGLRRMRQAREEYLSRVKAMAAEEAGIGGSLEAKAAARLQSRGVTEFSAADLAQERADMEREAREAHGAFVTGGTVSADQYALMNDMASQFAKMRELGTTGAQAQGMFQAQTNAAYAGRAFNAIPTGLQSMAPELQAIASQMKESADSAVERLGATLQNVFEYFVQKLNRKLEFESARQ